MAIIYEGALLNDSAPYSAIGIHELQSLRPVLLPELSGELEDLPGAISGYTSWRYGIVTHSSTRRSIAGSIMVNVKSYTGFTVLIRELILESSSQRIAKRNFTENYDIIHAASSKIRIHSNDGSIEHISFVNNDLHSYIPLPFFKTSSDASTINLFECVSLVTPNDCN